MAEGLLKSMWSKDWNPAPVIHSAGTHATEGLPAEPFAVRVAGEYGVDIRAHRSRALDAAIVKKADLILAVTQQHVDFIRNSVGGGSGNLRLLCGLNADSAQYDVKDPYGGSLDTYRECARMISGCLAHVVTHFIENSGGKKMPGSLSG